MNTSYWRDLAKERGIRLIAAAELHEPTDVIVSDWIPRPWCYTCRTESPCPTLKALRGDDD